MGPNLIILDMNLLCIGNRSLDIGTGASRRTLLGNGVSQGTLCTPTYNLTTVPRLLFLRTVLLSIEFLNDGLASLGRLRLAMRNSGPKAEYCSWANLDLGPGEDESLAIRHTCIHIYCKDLI